MWSFTQEEIVSDLFEVESQRSAWRREGYLRPLRESALREVDTLQHEWPALVGWSLVVNERMRSVFGRCHYGRRTLHVAAWHAEHGEWADVLDTLRH